MPRPMKARAWAWTALMTAAFACSAVASPAERATAFRLPAWPQQAVSPDLALVDATGRARTLADFRGRVVIVFFGFLHCPDACPAELYKMSLTLRQLGADSDRVQVLFITLDPARDTPSLLEAYVGQFDARFMALTGSAAQVNRAAADFHVDFAQVPQGADYTIDHSTSTFLFDKGGRLRLIGTMQTSSADFAHDLALLVRE